MVSHYAYKCNNSLFNDDGSCTCVFGFNWNAKQDEDIQGYSRHNSSTKFKSLQIRETDLRLDKFECYY